MEEKGWRDRISRCFDQKAPSCRQPIDEKIRELGGSTSAFYWLPDEVQAQKEPISMQEQISSLIECNYRLSCELECYSRLNEGVWAIVPQVASHVDDLSLGIERYVSKMYHSQRQSKPWRRRKVKLHQSEEATSRSTARVTREVERH